MNTSDSIQALRRANPRAKAGFTQSVEAADEAVRGQIVTTSPVPRARRSHQRGRLVRVSAAGASLAAAAALAALLTVGSPDGGPGVESAAAAVKRAATVTAASAERSGTAVVRITHNGELWAGTTVRWHDGDLGVSRSTPRRQRKAGGELLLVDGMLYGVDPGVDGGWIMLGSPASIDPDSGTTPDEYLAAVREDIGGATLSRIAGGVSGLTTTQRDDGTTVYAGTVGAGEIARETGFKEGQPIRVLPFGYVAHDEAANAAALLDAAVTVGADGIVRQIAVSWGTGSSAWTYTVTYSDLGATPPLAAPANARPLREGHPPARP
jgi:hypothetical protein